MDLKVQNREDLATLSRLNIITAAFQLSLQLNIYEILGEDTFTLEELAKRSNCHENKLEVLLNILEQLSLIIRQDHKYSNSDISKYYLKGLYNRRLLENVEAVSTSSVERYLIKNWDGKHSIKNDSITSKLDAYEDGGIYSAIRLWRELKPKGEKTLLDVGCGSGVYSTTLCKYSKGLYAECIDKKEVINELIPKINNYGLQNRISVRECDIASFDFTGGRSYDYILLSNILHFFNEDDIVKILRICNSALNNNGVLIVNDIFFQETNIETLFFSFGYLMSDIVFIPLEKMLSHIKQTGLKITNEFNIENTPSTIILAHKAS